MALLGSQHQSPLTSHCTAVCTPREQHYLHMPIRPNPNNRQHCDTAQQQQHACHLMSYLGAQHPMLSQLSPVAKLQLILSLHELPGYHLAPPPWMGEQQGGTTAPFPESSPSHTSTDSLSNKGRRTSTVVVTVHPQASPVSKPQPPSKHAPSRQSRHLKSLPSHNYAR